jgi:hypothetical protein
VGRGEVAADPATPPRPTGLRRWRKWRAAPPRLLIQASSCCLPRPAAAALRSIAGGGARGRTTADLRAPPRRDIPGPTSVSMSLSVVFCGGGGARWCRWRGAVVQVAAGAAVQRWAAALVGPLVQQFFFFCFRENLRRELIVPPGTYPSRGVPPALGKHGFAGTMAPRGLHRELPLGEAFNERNLALGEGPESGSVPPST